MAWLGFITLITLYWCIFVAVTSSRLNWAVICIWLLPILAMALTYKTGMEINGLMVLTCFVLFMLCRRGLTDIKLWNERKRKRHTWLFVLIYALSFIMLVYSFAQAQIQGYLPDIQGWRSDEKNSLIILLTLILTGVVNFFFARLLLTALDRAHCRKKDIVLLECRFFTANRGGAEKGILKGYYLEGIQNGITYQFRMTKRMFYMLKKEPHLKLQEKIGLLNGYYITDMDVGEFLKRTRRMDRRSAVAGMMGFVIAAALGIALFFVK